MTPPRKRSAGERSRQQEKVVGQTAGPHSSPGTPRGRASGRAPQPMRAFSERLASLVASTEQALVEDAVVHDARALRTELSEALEELRVAAEELQHQNDLLDVAGAEMVGQMARYRDLFDFAPDGYLVLDRSGVIREANVAAGALFGIDAGELVGRSLLTLVAPSDRAAATRLVREAARGRSVREGDLLLHHHDGPVPVWVRLGAATGGEDDRLRCLLRDVSEARAAQQRFNEALQRQRDTAARLREMDDTKNAFLLAVSHDLRGPLSAILMLAQLLADTPVQPRERARRIGDSIAANVARVQRVQRDLLDLDRLARRAVVLVRRTVDVPQLVERSIMSADAVDHVVSTRVDVPKAALDEAVAARILDNLVSNAITHTPRGTPVEVAVERWDEGVLVTVADRGPGIASERRRSLFRSFPAIHDDAARNGQGMGVGLHLVSRFAALHGGRAWVEETPGGGATFRVTLRERP